MQSPPLVQASVATPFVDLVQSLSADAEAELARHGLPVALLESSPGSRSTRIEEGRLYAFLHGAAEALDLPGFGLVAGLRSPLEDLGPFGLSLRQSLTLHDAVGAFLSAVNDVSTHASFWVERDGDLTWFCRGGIPQLEHGERQAELYVLSLLTQIVRLAAGPAWVPARVRVKARALPGESLPEGFGAEEVRCAQSCTAIAFRSELLPFEVEDRPESRTIERLRRNLVAELGRSPGIDQAATWAGCSPRTLQRDLERLGLTYRRLLDQVRHGQARERLARGLPVLDVALELGYAEHSSFTRAFRRWTGSSPQRFRSRVH